MIRHISIRNFAIISNADVDFHDGLNIITGETGAGKSIVIEAVSLALGSRADTAFVRSGENKAVIQMIAEHDGQEYIITREISASGKNICRINDEIVTLGHLSKLCRKLADIHGQYDHQSLLNPEYHIHLVDLYQKDKTIPAKERVSECFEAYSKVRKELSDLISMSGKQKRERDFMAFELQELEAASLQSGEDDSLEDEINILQNSEKIYENLGGAYHTASEDEYSILSALRKVSDMLEETSGYSRELEELSQRTNELYYEFEDICSSIRDCRDNAIFSPEELDCKIARYELISKLKSKYGMSIDELISYKDELMCRLSDIDNLDAAKAQLEKKLSSIEAELKEACRILSEIRRESARKLEEKIKNELSQLNFNDADFSIEFSDSETFTQEGTDLIEFKISTNRGEPMKPLSKIASGGEMSRIMLAFKKIIGDYDEIPTMIFDEIDSGISGIAASVVGHKLSEIAQNHQIICITHLPQIAAFGQHNYKIAKSSDDTMTYTTVTELSEDEKTHEIARLLGGTNITETTLKSARELIDASE
ncbi:MAG: DNA repair protein RecN [Bacillota bacterium]|nr:DNA repair protein RecN [Bacillota bacterium]